MGSFFNWIIGNGVAKYLGRLVVGKNSLEGLNVTVAASGSATMTTGPMLGGMLLHDPSGAVAALTTPTAALIVAALGDAAIKGVAFKFGLRNTGSGGEVISLVAGAGVTLSPTTLEVDADEIINLLVRLDNVVAGSEAVTIYGLGFSVLTT